MRFPWKRKEKKREEKRIAPLGRATMCGTFFQGESPDEWFAPTAKWPIPFTFLRDTCRYGFNFLTLGQRTLNNAIRL